jgi:hypothetical protein
MMPNTWIMQDDVLALFQTEQHPLQRTAKLTEGYNGSDLVEVVRRTARRCWRLHNPAASTLATFPHQSRGPGAADADGPVDAMCRAARRCWNGNGAVAGATSFEDCASVDEEGTVEGCRDACITEHELLHSVLDVRALAGCSARGCSLCRSFAVLLANGSA